MQIKTLEVITPLKSFGKVIKLAYKPLRKDLTDGNKKCHFCSKKLSSLKAYVLEDTENKEHVYAGPTCTLKNIDSNVNLSSIPDLTKYTCTLNENNSDGGGRGFGKNPITTQEENLKRALEYLELRENKLKICFSKSYQVLSEYYMISRQRELKDNEIKHILNIENKAPDNLKLKNLQKCYNYLFWIDVAIDLLREQDRDFLENIRQQIIVKLKISQSQKDAVNRWIQNLSGVPQIK